MIKMEIDPAVYAYIKDRTNKLKTALEITKLNSGNIGYFLVNNQAEDADKDVLEAFRRINSIVGGGYKADSAAGEKLLQNQSTRLTAEELETIAALDKIKKIVGK
jgi:hypothetical protein